MSVYLSVCLCGCLCVCMYVCLADYLPACLTIWLSVCMAFGLLFNVCLSVNLSVCLNACLSVCLSVCQSVFLYVSVCVCLKGRALWGCSAAIDAVLITLEILLRGLRIQINAISRLVESTRENARERETANGNLSETSTLAFDRWSESRPRRGNCRTGLSKKQTQCRD